MDVEKAVHLFLLNQVIAKRTSDENVFVTIQLRDRRQVSLLMFSKFKSINFYHPLKSSEDFWFFNDLGGVGVN